MDEEPKVITSTTNIIPKDRTVLFLDVILTLSVAIVVCLCFVLILAVLYFQNESCFYQRSDSFDPNMGPHMKIVQK